MTHRVYINEDGVCSCCDGDKIIGHGKVCPNCNGTGQEPPCEIDEDPRYRDCEGDPVVPEMREFYERRKVDAEKS